MTNFEIREKLIEAGEALIGGFKRIAEGEKISAALVFDLICELVITAEFFVEGVKRGAVKHEIVRDAFAELDRKCQLCARIDEMIKLPVWLEFLDRRLIRGAINLLIVQAVSMMNRKFTIVDAVSDGELRILLDEKAESEIPPESPPYGNSASCSHGGKNSPSPLKKGEEELDVDSGSKSGMTEENTPPKEAGDKAKSRKPVSRPKKGKKK